MSGPKEWSGEGGLREGDGVNAELPVYREVQHFRQWWVWLIVVAVAGLGWWTLIQQLILGRPLGDDPLPDWGAWLVWVLFGIGLPLLLWNTRLVTEVAPGRLTISFWPLTRRTIPLAALQETAVRSYNPLREYGGWGVKGWSRRNIAYNVSGDRGVQLLLEDGRRVLIGSQRPEELARSIEALRAPV